MDRVNPSSAAPSAQCACTDCRCTQCACDALGCKCGSQAAVPSRPPVAACGCACGCAVTARNSGGAVHG